MILKWIKKKYKLVSMDDVMHAFHCIGDCKDRQDMEWKLIKCLFRTKESNESK